MNKNNIKEKFIEFCEIIKELGLREIEKDNIADDPIKHILMVISAVTNEVEDKDFSVHNHTTH